MKLTEEHLYPYLEHNLKVSKIHTLHAGVGIGSIEQIARSVNKNMLSQYKPIMRPLSDLDIPKYKEIFNMDPSTLNVYELPYKTARLLFKLHFDVFRLIDNNLARNINLM